MLDKISDPFGIHGSSGYRYHTAYEQGGTSSVKELFADELYDVFAKTSIIGSAVLFPSTFTQLVRLPALFRGGMSLRTAYSVYGGHLTPFPGIGMIVAGELYSHFKSRSQDEKSGASAPSVKPKTLRGNSKPSRPVSSGQTSKPFWSNGKPKCKKGFRYDFKRKLCVKIK